ncbi:MAG: branched-chain amino acid ABC transporter permease [Archaeoglobaceae archaeon]|nr:branched-chain amino acid ABC transporter permease [Archaeoglobaceae archaeon]
MKKPDISLWWITIAVIVLIVIPVVTKSPILRESVFLILLYMTLALSLNIILGYTGYVSFGHIVYYGIGGYVTFSLIYFYGINLIVAMIIGGLFAAAIAYSLGQAILKLRGAYFAIATIGVNEAVKALVNNLDAIGGAEGLYFNIKVYNAYGGAENAIWLSYYLMSALIIITLIVNWYIKKSKFGLGLMAIREDEDAAIILGVDTRKYKSLAYMLSALFPGIAGGIFFFKNGNIEPENAFHLVKSIEMIFMVMLGGFGTVTGPVLGALVYERIRGLLLINPLFKNLHIAISGVVLLLIVLFMPSGIIGYVREKIAKIRRYIE